MRYLFSFGTVEVLCFLSLLASVSAGERRALVPESLDAFYLNPDESSTLRWRIAKGGAAAPGYQIRNYEGKVVDRGNVAGKDGEVSLTVSLSKGYYDLVLGEEAFGLVVQPAFVGEPDPFFGMDAVLTWLDRREESRSAMVGAMKRAGIAIARERIHWAALEPAEGRWDWDGRDRTLALRELYARAGIPVLEMFHSPGPARGPFPFRSTYPQNLALLARSWPEIHRRFQSGWAGLEVWNEPEGPTYGRRLPADQYVMLVKAMRYAWQVNGIDTPLGGGVFMGGNPGDFHRFTVLNGMLDAIDFVSIHDYKPATKTERLVASYREWLQASGKSGMPIWITESGWSWPKGGGRPLLDDDRQSALEIVMKAVEARACGVARYMPFCLAFYEEGGAKSFSMMGREVTPLRSFGAYARCIAVLAGKTYVGDLSVDDPVIRRARVFRSRDGAEQIAVIYTDLVGSDHQVLLPGAIDRVEGIDGRPLPKDAAGRFALPDGMAYAWIRNPEMRTDTEAAALGRAASEPFQRNGLAASIVLQFLPDPAKVGVSSTRYIVNAEAAGQFPLRVKVHNLAPVAVPVALQVCLPNGLNVPAPAVEVPGLGTSEVNWTLDLSTMIRGAETTPLVVTGSAGADALVDALAIPLLIEGELASYLPAYASSVPLAIGALSEWTPNHSGGAAVTMEALAPGGWRMNARFGDGERWAYPRFRIEKGVLANAGGFLLRARTTGDADVRMVLQQAGGASYLTFDPVIPADGRWHVIHVPIESFEANQEAGNKGDGAWSADEITDVSVGINDRSDERANTLEVSDLIIVGPKVSPKALTP